MEITVVDTHHFLVSILLAFSYQMQLGSIIGLLESILALSEGRTNVRSGRRRRYDLLAVGEAWLLDGK